MSYSNLEGDKGHPYYSPTYSPSQPTPHLAHEIPYGSNVSVPTYPHQQDTPFSSNGPYRSNGGPLSRERSPSPTPSDIEAMKRPVVDWKPLLKWRTYAKLKYVPWYLALIITCVLVILMSVYHKEIVGWLTPAAEWMHGVTAGWIIPIVVLVVLSFPPLFGHEIVGVLCGVVWGLWLGFLIMCAGTLLGEIATYYVFKYFCRARAEKLERSKASYACLGRVVREGGFKVCLMARLSALPSHFTTAIFATCGMNIFAFTLAAFLSLPKQFITVYVGVMLEHSNDSEEERKKAQTSRLISNIALVITLIITFAALWWIWKKMMDVRPIILRERRIAKKRAMALSVAGAAPLVNESNPELDSILGHTPLKENEGSWGGGGYGYSGVGKNPSGAPYNGRSREEWELSETHFEPSAYQSQRRDYTEPSDNTTPVYGQDRGDSSHVVYRQGPSTDINRTNAQLQSDPYQTPTQQTFSSPQQQWQSPAFPSPPSVNRRPVDPSPSPPPRKAETGAPSTGPRTFGVTLTDSGPARTVSVGSKKSVEMHSGHTIGRSFRASIEGEGDYSSGPGPSKY